MRLIYRGFEDEYEVDDSRLVGQGNPPGDPVWQQKNPGAGQLQMVRVSVPDDYVLGSFFKAPVGA